MARFSDADVQAILQSRRIVQRIPLPGQSEVEVGVRLLSDRQVDLCRFEAQLYLSNQAKKTQQDLVEFINIDPESLDREHMRQVIYNAFVDVDSDPSAPMRFFSDIHEVRQLDSVMVQQFWEAYVDFQDAVNPRLRLTEEEVEQLAAALKEPQSEQVVLAHFERDTLQSLVRFLAARQQTSTTGSASTSPS